MDTMLTPLSSHLSADRLAALADNELTTAEAAHVGVCPECARELAAHRRLLSLARQEAAVPSLPLTRWDDIAAQLRATGTIRRSGGWSRWAGRAAAALLFLAAGAAVGRFSATMRPTMQRADTTAGPSTNVALADRDDSTPIFRSSAEAMATLTRAERDYRHAAAYLVAEDSGSEAPTDRREAYRTRLAALDEVAQTTRAALEEAPNDPVLNQYYFSTVGARDATLRQLKGALPVGMRLGRY